MRITKYLVVGLVVALVAACGGNGADDTTTTTSGSPDPSAPAEELTQTPGVLTVGSDIPWEPFEFYGDDGVLTGYDVELIEEIASRMDLTVEWIETDFDTIFTQLATGRFDVVASGTTITPARAQQVDFTTPYYNAEQALAVNLGETPHITSVGDLAEGDRVAVQTGTTGEEWAEENLAPLGIDVVSYLEAADTYIALEGGQVEAVVFDEPSVAAEAANRAAIELVDVISTNEQFGFGVDPARSELLAAVNATLQSMFDDGTYQAIYDKWFPEAPAGSVLWQG